MGAPRFLITRPRADAELLAAKLWESGYHSVVEPMTDIVFYPEARTAIFEHATHGAQAILLTSKYAVAALKAATLPRRIRLIVAGSSAYRAAERAGFVADYAGENGAALLHFVRTHETREQGLLLYAAGKHVTRDLAAVLSQEGFNISRVNVYEARAAGALSEELQARLRRGEIQGTLFYSPRHAGIFEELAKTANVLPSLGSVDALCLSARIASVLWARWRHLYYAPAPTTASMLVMIKDLYPIKG